MIVAAPQILEGFSSHQRAAQVSGDQGARAERLVCIPQRPGGMFLFLDSSLAIKTLMSARDSVGVGIPLLHQQRKGRADFRDFSAFGNPKSHLGTRLLEAVLQGRLAGSRLTQLVTRE